MPSPAIAIVDTGPLLAAIDRDDPAHQASAEALTASGLRLVVPALVVAEVSYLVSTRIGPDAEATFLEAMGSLDVIAPAGDDWPRIAELVRQYRDFPLGGTDASIIALAERLRVETIITLDRRHFGAVRPHHCASFRLLPASF